MRTLEDLTEQMERSDEAAAFIVASLAPSDLRYHVKHGDPADADHYFRARPSISKSVALRTKAAVTALTTGDGLAPQSPEARAFLALADRRTVLTQLGAVTLPPMNASVTVQVGNATASWVGEANAKPISSLSFNAAGLKPNKLTTTVVGSDELFDLSLPAALQLVMRALTSALASALDTALLDPTSAAIAGVRPASLTNGLTGITPAGDYQNQAGQVLAGISGGAPTRPVFVANLQSALRLTALRDLESIGVRVLVTPAAGNRLIAIDADGIAVTDGGVEIVKGQPDLQMDDSPTNPSTSATVMVSTWQRNLAAVRVERYVSWVKRSDAVAFLTLA